MVDIDSLSDPEQLRTVCRAYEASHRTLNRRIEELAREIAVLKGLDTAQASLELPDLKLSFPEVEKVSEPSAPPKKRTQQRGHGPTPQPQLPIEDLGHSYKVETLPSCPSCGGRPELWEGQSETSEEITVVETTYKLVRHHRAKYRCPCHGSVLTAPGPAKLIPGGRYSVEFAAHSAVEKFCDHIPLERQTRRAARQGLTVTSQTLWDQQAALAGHLEPTWNELRRRALSQDVLHVDETGWRMMGAKKSKWTLFGLTAPHLAVYHLADTKSAAKTREILSGFRGTLVVDGYKVYPIVAELDGLRIAHCWFHADRKLKDAKDPPGPISKIRSLIHQLYEIEREVEGPFPGPQAAQTKRLALRQEKSRPVIEQIRHFAFEQGGLRRSDFGKALRYLLNHWDGLTLFLEDPRIRLDNNPAERALRGPVVGRKNFYGNRSKRGAHTTAILYTLIETAKLNGVNPSQYLKEAASAAIEHPGTVTLPF